MLYQEAQFRILSSPNNLDTFIECLRTVKYIYTFSKKAASPTLNGTVKTALHPRV